MSRPPLPALPALPTTRRTAVGAATALGLTGALAVLGGCSEDAPAAGGSPATRGGATPTSSDRGIEQDPDAALVDRVAADIDRLRGQLRAEARAHPAEAERLRRFERLHARHAAELGPRADARRDGPAASRRAAQVLPRLDRSETQLQRRLGAACLEARSGALALLLASMAAGVAQERSLL